MVTLHCVSAVKIHLEMIYQVLCFGHLELLTSIPICFTGVALLIDFIINSSDAIMHLQCTVFYYLILVAQVIDVFFNRLKLSSLIEKW